MKEGTCTVEAHIHHHQPPRYCVLNRCTFVTLFNVELVGYSLCVFLVVCVFFYSSCSAELCFVFLWFKMVIVSCSNDSLVVSIDCLWLQFLSHLVVWLRWSQATAAPTASPSPANFNFKTKREWWPKTGLIQMNRSVDYTKWKKLRWISLAPKNIPIGLFRFRENRICRQTWHGFKHLLAPFMYCYTTTFVECWLADFHFFISSPSFTINNANI